jgi:predicted adenine nucleotide alpha hydrolase (AANH) superfamily ATPase
MKTTIDIPKKDLEEVLKHTQAKTKKEAIVFVVQDFNKRRRLMELAKVLGTFKEFMTQDDLKKSRQDDSSDSDKDQ